MWFVGRYTFNIKTLVRYICNVIKFDSQMWLKKALTVSKHWENSWNVGLAAMNNIYRSLKELNEAKDIWIDWVKFL